MSEDRAVHPGKERLRQARAAGHAVSSPELSAAAGWLCLLAAAIATGPNLVRTLVAIMERSITIAGSAEATAAPAWTIRLALAILAPSALAACAFATGSTLAHLLQTRNLWSLRRLAPNPRRLWRPAAQPPSWSSRAWNSLSTALRSAAILLALASGLKASWPSLARLSTTQPHALVAQAGRIVFQIGFILGDALVVLGVVDYAVRRRQFLNQLRMTDAEQRQEQKVREGDPAARAQRRRLARRRGQEAVARARELSPP